MESRGNTFWLVWFGMAALLALSVAIPFFVGVATNPYGDAGISVLALVLSLLAVTAAVGSLASREALVRSIASGAVDPRSPQDFTHTLRTLVWTWTLCLVVSGLGTTLAASAAKTSLGLPYWVAAATLLAFHAPRAAILSGARSRAPQ